MKILHLSDLHIGKIIYEQSLLEDQEYKKLNSTFDILIFLKVSINIEFFTKWDYNYIQVGCNWTVFLKNEM